MGGTTNVFLVYTKEDSAILLQLLRHIDPIKKFVKVHFWYDDPIDPNREWSPQIVSRFEEADVYLFLVSNTFMHAKFVEQLEFKMIIDRYKAGQSKVIPLILENCPWDIDFEADEYSFSFKELHVLPEAAKPLKSFESTEQALQKCAAYIRQIIAPGTIEPEEELSRTKKKTTSKQEVKVDQVVLPFPEKDEARRKAEAIGMKEDIVAQKAAAAQKLGEQIEVDKRAAEKQRLQDVAEAKSKYDEQKRMLQQAEAKRRIQDENRRRVSMEAKLIATKVAQAESNEEEQENHLSGNKTRKKQLLFGASVLALIVLGILFFPRNSTEASEKLSPQENNEAISVKETNNAVETYTNDKIQAPTQGAAASMSKLEIGGTFNDGIIFELDGNGKSGILAHKEDAGPMIWNDAIIIHEQLGIGWRLPSIEELKKMYKTIGQGANNSGDFADEFYWSATPFDVNQARLVRFSDGNASYHYNSRGTHRKFLVRAVRDFSL